MTPPTHNPDQDEQQLNIYAVAITLNGILINVGTILAESKEAARGHFIRVLSDDYDKVEITISEIPIVSEG